MAVIFFTLVPISSEAKYVCKWGNCNFTPGICTDGKYFYNYIPQCININYPNWCVEVLLPTQSGKDCSSMNCYFCSEPPVDCEPHNISCGGNTYYEKLYIRYGEQEWVPENEPENLGPPSCKT